MKILISLFCALIAFNAHTQQTDCATDRHSPFLQHAWLSCNEQPNPNPLHGPGHWIQFDFGDTYVLDSSWIWNYNAWGLEALGVRDMIVEYSTSGLDWTVLDTFTVAQAAGSYKDTGARGPVFGNAHARYVLLTVVDTWGPGSPCAGLSEIRFGIGEQTTSVRPEMAEPAPQIMVYPNPASTKASLSWPEGTPVRAIQISTVQGTVLETLRPTQAREPLDVSKLPEGIYLVTAIFDVGTTSQKLIVTRN